MPKLLNENRRKSLRQKSTGLFLNGSKIDGNYEVDFKKKKKNTTRSSINTFFSTKTNKKAARIRQTLLDMGIDNMKRDDYIPSSLDLTDLFTVQVVDLLKQSGGRGLFATADIPQGTCIGIYTGEVYPTHAAFAQYLLENPSEDNSYAMSIGRCIVDGAKKGNFTRYINFSDSQDNAEFVEGTLNRRKVVKVITTKDIKEGQQLLINYNTYEERASKVYFFLNPNDGFLSAKEVYEAHAKGYQSVLMPQDLELFNLESGKTMLITQIARAVFENQVLSNVEGLDLTEIDLPVLKVKDNNEIFDFDEIDVFTPLMLACYLGRIENVQWLLEHGANPNQQQNHSGNCPLFFALEGYKIADDKTDFLSILSQLILKQANPEGHDRADRTFLHKAITVLSDNHFAFILNILKEQDSTKFKQLFGYIDENNFDIVVSCLSNKDRAKLILLLQSYPEFFAENYLSRNQDNNRMNIDAFKNAIQRYNTEERTQLLEVFVSNNINLPEDLLAELGLLHRISFSRAI